MRIIIFSAVPWTFLWQRYQQVASRLAKRGFDIMYFQNPIYLSPSELVKNHYERNIFLRRRAMVKMWIVNFFLPNFLGKFNFVAEKFGLLTFKVYLKCLNFKPDIAIFYSLYYVFLLDALKAKNVKIIYDCVDDVSDFYSASYVAREGELIKKSSIVIVSSKKLCEKVSKINSNCVYLPNAVDFEHFNSSRLIAEKPRDIKNLHPPIVGFVGGIYNWINIDLICKLAELHPDYSILLVGPVKFGLDQLKKYPNIIMTGTRKYQVLPKYLRFMDVCLIPFKINKLTISSNPIKMYEYLATGKPVVSTALPEVCENASQLVYIGNDENEFIRKVEEAVNQTKQPENAKTSSTLKRISFAKDNSWEKRVDTIEKMLRSIT